MTVLQEQARRDIKTFKLENEIRSKYRGGCCLCIGNTAGTRAIQFFDMCFFINPFRMVPAINARRDSRKYKSYSKARSDSFYVIWGLISLAIMAWLINVLILA